MGAFEGELETVVVDEPQIPRTRTPFDAGALPQMHRIELDLDDPDAVAAFLEATARVIRERRRIVLVIA